MTKKKVPVSDLTALIKKHHLKQAVLVAYDGENTYVVTDGCDEHQADQAAEGGNLVKRALNWPEQLCNAVSARVLKLKKRIADLERKAHGE